jgi:tetratricopeptide (TPR) repeat protein
MNPCGRLLFGAVLVTTGFAFAQTGIVVQATVTPAAGCRVVLTVDNKNQDVVLVRRTGDQLLIRLPDSPPNALSGVKFESVQAAEFAITNNDYAVFEATRTRQWQKAADLILATIEPCFPFLDLPRNNAAEPALEATLYLMRAAGAATREQKGVVTPAAAVLYARALTNFLQIAQAEWFPKREQARLRAVLCQVACGRLDSADALLESARIPDPGDGDYGLYELARASILFARGEFLEACNASARSIAFENKDPQVFPDALLLSARAHEELMDYYRARDIYFEISRLFGATEWGEIAFARLTFIMDTKLTAEKEKANIAKVFFGSEEDMDKVVRAFIKLRQDQDKQPDKAAK